MTSVLRPGDVDACLRPSIDSLREGIQILGYDWTYLYLNRAALEHARRDAADLLGRTIFACFPGFERTDIYREMAEAMRTRRARGLMSEFVYPSGERRWFDLHIDPVPAGLCVISLDVTDRQRLEASVRDTESRTRFAMLAAGMGTWQLHLASGEMHCSDAMAALLGLDPKSAPTTLDAFLERIEPADRDVVVREVAHARSGALPEFVIEFRVIRADGQKRWMKGHGRVLADTAGHPELVAGVGIDVTERRQVELQLQQGQRMEAVGRLAGGIAHDFNNQLTAILGFCDLALGQASHLPELSADLQEIRAAAERSAGLTRQLLAFSRRQVLHVVPFDLNETVSTIGRMVRRVVGANIRCELDLDAAPVVILGDTGQLEHAITNLAVNARDAMPDGGRFMIQTRTATLGAEDVRQHPVMRAGSYGVLTVLDNGCGMDEATRERVFEPFFTTKPAGIGTGLGLSTVYGIVKQMGGFIWVYSEVGVGTTFRLYLPLADALEAPGARAVPASPGARTGTVLVIEDEPAVREFAVRALAQHGYTVLQAESAEAALDRLAHGDPVDLLLADVMLSGRSSPEMVAGLASPPPVLYMSGYSEWHVRGREPASDGPLLEKPFTVDALLSAVAAGIAARRS